MKTHAITVRLPVPHERQIEFIRSKAKRKVIRAGRRGGKTWGAAILAVEQFLAGRRVLYAVPTTEQAQAFWHLISGALAEPIEKGVFTKNETSHTIERPRSRQRIRGKTAWNADTLRGDYADLLILDEWQLMAEDAWEAVGSPMLLDNNGDAVFIYTPPSLHSRSTVKARDPKHAAKLFARAAADPSGRWAVYHFPSQDNPHISTEALEEIATDMTALSYRKEILAEDIDDDPEALWSRGLISRAPMPAVLDRVVVGVDPTGGVAECGIVVAGIGPCACRGTPEQHGFVFDDRSKKGKPDVWAREVVAAYRIHQADRVIGEKNFGGDMVEATIRTVDPLVSYRDGNASRGKAARAEPVAALYEQGKVHHVGALDALEDEMTSWVPGSSKWSPNRLDALVWALTDLMLGRVSVHKPEALNLPVGGGGIGASRVGVPAVRLVRDPAAGGTGWGGHR